MNKTDNMNIMQHNMFKLSILFMVSIFFLACPIKRNEEFYLYRCIDHLGNNNIISSPFQDLEKKFQRIKQQWSGSDLTPLTINEMKYYSISTQLPILAWEAQHFPKIMKITSEGKEIPFIVLDPNTLGWNLNKGEKEFDDFYEKGIKTKVLSLEKNKRFEKNILLPDGEFLLQIWASSIDFQTNYSKLTVELNDAPIGEILIGPDKRYKMTGRAKLGWNKISLVCEAAGFSKGQSEKTVLIDKISIKSLKDLILLSLPKNTKSFLRSDYEAEYTAESVEKIYKIREKIQPSQPLVQEIQFDGFGKRTIEIIGHSSILDSSLTMKLNGQTIFKGKVHPNFQNIFAVEILSEKDKNALEFQIYSPQQGKGNFYLSDIIVKNTANDLYLPLIKMKHKAVMRELSIGKNPLNLKKKFVRFGYTKDKSARFTDDTINTLFAPPFSHFQFELKVPPSCELEFGCGFLNTPWKEQDTEVNFKVVIQDKRKEKILFSENLRPIKRSYYNNFHKKSIDLSSFSNKKVKINFITSSKSSSSNKIIKLNQHQGDIEFAYWENPIIYRQPITVTQNKSYPNIILISLDTLRADHLKCYGYKRETSPHIDQLSSDGVLFTNAFSSTSWTLPAHISLLTSLDNRHHQVNKANPHLDDSIITLADLLRKKGYFTHGFTGGALLSQRHGFSNGFDYYREFKRPLQYPKSAQILFDNFSRWLNTNGDKRFFLFLHTYQTHDPYHSPPPFNSQFFSNNDMPWTDGDMEKILYRDDKGKNTSFSTLSPIEQENIVALYDGEIRFTDEKLMKPLIKKLKKNNLYQNTMIILTSDHGEEFFDHGAWLHGHTLYNELIQIPLIIKFPHSKFKNIQLDRVTRIVDIMPTILDEIGINFSSHELDGVSVLNYLNNEDQEEQMLIADLGSGGYPYELPARIAVNFKGFKLILNRDYGHPPEHYLPVPPPIARIELYDMKNDPLERQNIADQNPKLVRELIDKIYVNHPIKSDKAGKKKTTLDKDFEETLRALGYIR
jgi:arylsulfatase A-like enzyme